MKCGFLCIPAVVLCVGVTVAARGAQFQWKDAEASGAWTNPAMWVADGGAVGFPNAAGDAAALTMKQIDVSGIDNVTVGSLSVTLGNAGRELSGAGLTFQTDGGAGSAASLHVADIAAGTLNPSRLMVPVVLASDLSVRLDGARPFAVMGGMGETGGSRGVTLTASASPGNPALAVSGEAWTFTGGMQLVGGADLDHYATLMDYSGAYGGAMAMSGYARYVTAGALDATLAADVTLQPGGHAVLGRLDDDDLLHGCSYTGVISGTADELMIYTTSIAGSAGRFAVTIGGSAGPNTYTGETVIAAARGGKVVAEKDGAFGRSASVTVMAESVLRLEVCDTIYDAAAVYLAGGGASVAGRLELANGAAEVVSALYLWDDGASRYVRQASGTWGSTSSGAQYTSDEWFAGTGLLYVGALGQTGDVDGDGVVDASDYVRLKSNMGLGAGADRSDGDLNGDGDVDCDDLQLLRGYLGSDADGATYTSATVPNGSAMVPDPCSALLLALGACLAGVSRRRAARPAVGLCRAASKG